MRYQLKIFLTALMFYTRFPVRKIEGWNETMLNKSTRYFPLIGIFVGALGAASFWAFSLILPLQVAVLLSMAITVLFTGAFHEDGFADFCDGFGGGSTPARILEITKDSRLGTYGTIGLTLMLGTKFLVLSDLEAVRIPLILIAGHAVSRIFPVIMIYSSSYARLDASSKTKPVGKADSMFSLFLALFFGGITLVFLSRDEIMVVLIVSGLLTFFFKKYVEKKLGGYTGDVLGALQQLCELVFYLIILALKNW